MPISIYDPRVLDQIVQVMPAQGGFFRDMLFLRRTPVTGKKIDVDFYKGKRRISPFVNPKSSAKTVQKIGYHTDTFETPLLKPKDVTTIEDVKVRMMGEPLYGGMTAEERAVQMLSEKLFEFNDMNKRREEWMAATAMLTGVIPVIGEGVNYNIDFGFSNKEALSGTALWSNTSTDESSSCDPLGDIDRWILACQQNGYHTPNICLMERQAYENFIKRLKEQNIMDQYSGNYELAKINPTQLSENVIYGGMILKYNLPIYIYNEWYIDDWTDPANPVEKALVPTGTVMLASTNARYTIYYGEIVIADETFPEGFRSIIGEQVADTWVTKDPDQRFIALHSRPLPVPHEVDSWYVATVL